MNLFHRGTNLGKVSGVISSGFEHSGNIALLPAFDPYREVFNFFDDEGNDPDKNLPFSEEWLDGWSIEDNEGRVRDISFPAFDKNYSVVSWRWS